MTYPTPPTAGNIPSADEIDNVVYPRHKMGYGEEGSFTDISLTNPLPIGDFELQVSRGLHPGLSHINKFGFNPAIGTGSDPEDLWDRGGLWVGPTAARIHTIVSTSVEDGAAGLTGALTMRVLFLDSDLALATEDVELNGQGNVLMDAAAWRIYRMVILTAGSTESNIGIITATAAVDGTVTAQIAVTEGQTLMAIYTVPAGKTAYMTRAYATIDGSGGTTRATLTIKQRKGIEGVTPVTITRHRVSYNETGTSARSWEYHPPKIFSEKTDIIMRIDSVTGTIAISGGFDLILVDN